MLPHVRMLKASATDQRRHLELVRDAGALAPVQTVCTKCI